MYVKWGSVAVILAVVAMVISVAALSGCPAPAIEEDPGAMIEAPPPEEMPDAPVVEGEGTEEAPAEGEGEGEAVEPAEGEGAAEGTDAPGSDELPPPPPPEG